MALFAIDESPITNQPCRAVTRAIGTASRVVLSAIAGGSQLRQAFLRALPEQVKCVHGSPGASVVHRTDRLVLP